jgi:uncharacterized membrane protein YfcA
MTSPLAVIGILLAVLIGVALGFFGAGGSVLTVPLLLHLLGMAPKDAIATSLLIVAVTSVASVIPHARIGHVRPVTAALFGLAGMAGAYAGGYIARWIDGSLLLLLFAATMVYTAVAMWRGRRSGAATAATAYPHVRLVLQGAAVGLFTGLVGAGGGFVIVPALTLLAGLPVPVAVGTSLLVIAMNALAGFAAYAGHARVDYSVAAAVSAAAVVGSWIGSQLTARVDPRFLRRSFAGLVIGMAIVVGAREAGRWAELVAAGAPTSAAQLVFVLLVLTLGVGLGHARQRPRDAARGAIPNGAFEHGAGI